MAAKKATPPASWVEAWLDAVASGERTMSRRSLVRVQALPGGVPALVRLARARGVHLLRLTDDEGVDLVAASSTPFKVLC